MDIRGFNTVNSYRTNFTPVIKAGAEMDEIRAGFIDVTQELHALFYKKGELVEDILKITSLPTGHDLIIERLEKLMESNEDLAINMRQCILHKGNTAEDLRLKKLMQLVEKVESFEERRVSESRALSKHVEQLWKDGLLIDELREEGESREKEIEDLEKDKEHLQAENNRLTQELAKKETEVDVLREVQDGKDQNITTEQLEQALVKIFEQQTHEQGQSLEDQEANVKQLGEQLQVAAQKYIGTIATVEQVRAKRQSDAERIAQLTEANDKLETENKKLKINETIHQTICPAVLDERDTLKKQVDIFTNREGTHTTIEFILREEIATMKKKSERDQALRIDALKGWSDEEKRREQAENNAKHWLEKFSEQKTAAQTAIVNKRAQVAIKESLQGQLADEQQRVKDRVEEIKRLKEEHRNVKHELEQQHHYALQKEIEVAETAKAETRSVRKDLEQKLEIEATERRQAENRRTEALEYNRDLNKQVTTARIALEAEVRKSTQLQKELESINTELTTVKARLITAEEERDTERASVQSLEAATTQADTITAERWAKVKNDLKVMNDSISELKLHKQQNEEKQEELTKLNEQAKEEISYWRCIVLREVLGLENWASIPMQGELLKLLECPWPAVTTVQEKALVVVGEDSGFRGDVPWLALSIWGKASMENPNLGLDDINNFAAALQGFRYQPRILAFLQASIQNMIGKDEIEDLTEIHLTEEQAIFCLRGLELLCRCLPDGLSLQGFGQIFTTRYPIPNVILVRAAERLVESLTEGIRETRGTAVKWALQKYGFPSYPLNDDYVLFPAKDQIFLVNDGEKMMQISYDNIECRANASTGRYIVSVFNKTGTIAKKEGDLSDEFGGVYAVFKFEDLGLVFD